MSVAEIKRAAAELPPREQAELVSWLLHRLPKELLTSSRREEPVPERASEAKLPTKEIGRFLVLKSTGEAFDAVAALEASRSDR